MKHVCVICEMLWLNISWVFPQFIKEQDRMIKENRTLVSGVRHFHITCVLR